MVYTQEKLVSHSLGGRKSEIGMPVWWGLLRASFPVQAADLSLQLRMVDRQPQSSLGSHV